MTKGLRCPNCDTTIHRKTVHDWLVNQTAPYLRCSNAFCNVRWKREVLEAHKDQFLGETKKSEPEPTITEREAEEVIEKIVAKRDPTPPALPKPPTPTAKTSVNWLRRMRAAARHISQTRGSVAIDDLRAWADHRGDHPEHHSMWGSVFQSDEWEKVGRRASSHAPSRSRQINVWSLKSLLLMDAS
jgi:hypothetical protein